MSSEFPKATPLTRFSKTDWTPPGVMAWRVVVTPGSLTERTGRTGLSGWDSDWATGPESILRSWPVREDGAMDWAEAPRAMFIKRVRNARGRNGSRIVGIAFSF